MTEENDIPVKRGRGRPKKENKSDVPPRVKRKYVRQKPISEPKSSKKRKKGKVNKKAVDWEWWDSEDSEENEGIDVDDLKNDVDDKEEEATPKKPKTKINYVGDVYIDTSDLSQYYTYENEINKIGENGYRCDICNLTFIGPEEDKKRIERHIVIHSEEKRTHICDTCGKKFSQKYYLKKHMFSHSNMKPFKCPVCDYVAKRKDHVRGHIKKRHSIGPDQYADKDGKPVTLEELGYGHLHLQVKPNEDGLYVCPKCDASFHSKKSSKQARRKDSQGRIRTRYSIIKFSYCKLSFTVKGENLT